MTSLLRDTLKKEESRVQDRPDNAEPATEDSENELISVVDAEQNEVIIIRLQFHPRVILHFHLRPQ